MKGARQELVMLILKGGILEGSWLVRSGSVFRIDVLIMQYSGLGLATPSKMLP